MTAYRRPLPAAVQPQPPVRQLLHTPWGPCTNCGTRCRRYGPGGCPLCDPCNPRKTGPASAA